MSSTQPWFFQIKRSMHTDAYCCICMFDMLGFYLLLSHFIGSTAFLWSLPLPWRIFWVWLNPGQCSKLWKTMLPRELKICWWKLRRGTTHARTYDYEIRLLNEHLIIFTGFWMKWARHLLRWKLFMKLSIFASWHQNQSKPQDVISILWLIKYILTKQRGFWFFSYNYIFAI